MAQAMIDKGLSILMTCHQTIRVCTRITDAEEHEIVIGTLAAVDEA